MCVCMLCASVFSPTAQAQHKSNRIERSKRIDYVVYGTSQSQLGNNRFSVFALTPATFSVFCFTRDPTKPPTDYWTVFINAFSIFYLLCFFALVPSSRLRMVSRRLSTGNGGWQTFTSMALAQTQNDTMLGFRSNQCRTRSNNVHRTT